MGGEYEISYLPDADGFLFLSKVAQIIHRKSKIENRNGFFR